MSNNWFQFKHFNINQEDCAMKVGTDSVLLGSWSDIPAGCSVLDIGTGTGVLALIAAQKGAARVSAVEIDAAAAAQAARNAADSEWADRIEVVECDVADYHPDVRFDRILSNPPYFRDSLRSPDRSRNKARHNDTLSYELLAASAARLLAPDGRLSVILPYESVGQFVRCAKFSGLYLARRTDVVTVVEQEPKRALLSFSAAFTQTIADVLYIQDHDGDESSGYKALVSDYYLKY